ncbi:hypothetical protein G7Y31_06830 [Corynebacterium lizhenjunii]|uniref:Uncharacterized protein n=1 Tax=Corynebacterium lizhenjunii TaxID=2709394 RepID=A0A7T0KD59_9CORY|nr:hypothetical protein [Corynebacterium lizhenjunii]QPK78299.1 hypothetical protein G7Y31_06830 [Corynebacterium lizhenjunii]
MANPAQLLHAQLAAWDNNGAAKLSRLSDGEDSQAQLAHELRIATMHLEAIREYLTSYDAAGGQASAMWWDALDRWTLGLFLYPHGWEHAQNESLAPSDLRLLQSLADLMQNQIPVLEDGIQPAMREFLGRIRTTASSATTDPHLARYLNNITNHVEWCLNNFDQVGEFELEKAWTHLAATIALLEQSDQHTPSTWTTIRQDWLNPFTVGSLAGMTGNLLAMQSMLMIGR